MKRTSNKNYTLESLKNALQQSGYLLEYRVANTFINLDYKVLNSFYFQQKMGETYREIDVVASNYLTCLPVKGNNLQHITFEVEFIVECIDAPFPLCLFENKVKRFVPQVHVPLSVYNIVNGTPRLQEKLSSIFSDFYETLEQQSPSSARQYCGFTQKKNKEKTLMAYHPDDLYKTINKLYDFVHQRQQHFFANWNDRQPDTTRIMIYCPLLVLGDKVFVVAHDEQRLDLTEVSEYKLLVDRGLRRSLDVGVTTETHLSAYIEHRITEILDLVAQVKQALA